MTESLNELIADVLDLDLEDAGDELSRETADNWDSLNHLRIVTAVERAFSIRLTMADIESATSVARLKEIVNARLEQR